MDDIVNAPREGITWFNERFTYRHKMRSSLGVPAEWLDIETNIATLEPGDALYGMTDGASDNMPEDDLAHCAARLKAVGIGSVVESIARSALVRSMDGHFPSKPDDITVTGLMLAAD